MTQRKGEVILRLRLLDHQIGIRESNAEAFVPAVNYSSIQAREMMQIWALGVDDERAGMQGRLDKVQSDLMKETILNARIDERLRNGEMQSGWQLLLANGGGGLFGYGIGDGFGSWPTVAARWWPK